ncbi:hypothetical protein HYH02_005164 [Chlamydomonas schloesseri]|uniref:Sepiapterin reductase n=1 Tax=Chlamydomonas schloesseri TaxID=2026947 RepID=A0A836B743_9CHLO|nr:hypothetical protein HYH02_005164 [Chlamydomonas schloesseri]|eukprot:KAG2449631.1 hypothetical protein HYH02_005164 [Chlamydomonas schloesseri]
MLGASQALLKSIRGRARRHGRFTELRGRNARPWQLAADPAVCGRCASGGLCGHAGVHTHAAAAASTGTIGGELPPVRYLTILTGASRGLGAAIALTLAERGPPLPGVEPPHAGASGSTSSTDSTSTSTSSRSSTGSSTATSDAARSPSWLHDMVLLASDPGRLDAFVSGRLQQAAAVAAAGSSTGAAARNGSGGAGGGGGAAPAPTAAEDAATDAAGSPDGSNRSPPSALRASSATGRGAGVTRLRTLAFDLGDLDRLEGSMHRLLSPVSASGLASPAAGAVPASASAGGEGAAAGAGSEGAGGGAGAAGVLPLPPAAYTHVLLVHNAGQVGDLLPIEDQSLPNMRRQTDLNVTSFTALTAAVLRAFLHTPVVTPDLTTGCAAAAAAATTTSAAACAAAAAAAGSNPDPGRQAQRQGTQVAAGPRRQVSVVNISSVSVDQPYEHFSLYGMGKAARHMVIRCLAHEAALREEAHAVRYGSSSSSSSSSSNNNDSNNNGSADTNGSSLGGSLEGGHAAAPPPPPPLARLRALSYAPGAIDTEMQAAAREALPAGRLKAAFEDNRRAGRLVDPVATSRVLYDILRADAYDNGAHTDFYSATAAARAAAAAAAEAAEAEAEALHPLAAARAAAAPASGASGAAVAVGGAGAVSVSRA